MRKIILFLISLLALPVFSQYVEKDIYEGVTISQDHHMTVCGVSMGLDVNTFENRMKQKGFVVSNNNADYESLYGLKGKLFGLPYSFIDLYVPAEDGKMEEIQIWKNYKTYQQAYNSFSIVKNTINRIYPHKVYKERISTYGGKNKELIGSWDIFTADETKVIGNITLSTDLWTSSGDLCFLLRITDLPNSLNTDRYTYKYYNLSKFVSTRCTVGYFYLYPTYNEIVLLPKGKSSYVHFETPSDKIVKLLNSTENTDFEKSLFFSQGLDKLEKPLESLNSNYYYKNLDGYINNVAVDYNYEKRKYLAAQQKQQQSKGMTSGEAMFEIWEGTANVQKYKKDGTYAVRLRSFINTWNAFAGGGSGGSGSNWDNLNDAQKAVIHQNDNGK